MKVFILSVLATSQAVQHANSQDCPLIDDTCHVDWYDVNPYDAGDNSCWTKQNRVWLCQPSENGTDCPSNSINVRNCSYKPSKDRCPTDRDYCQVQDMLLTRYQTSARYWKVTDEVGRYECTSEIEGDPSDWIDITTCP